ncbi:VOC family protein [Halobacterium sp. R2-5]|uniref:VOC family protein n=1 Tax=Halobacterium sp. R2-5 TaxID=2715751 RepID=UPI00141F4B19|nr:VOC family protein [Halobacterium sp. R2-5]NIB99443.1 VOC family protein [Halobacterium sp. R2-5]
MLSALDSLALEVRSLDRAAAFYEQYLGLDGKRRDHEAVYEVGDTTLVFREPSTVPRGGVHVHYAFSTTLDEYDAWRDRLGDNFDLVEFDFGSAQSIYFDDPDGHCVEIGTGGPDGDGALTGVFEVVLEVEDLERAEAFYRDLGFAVTDRGGDRERVRLGGPVDLELWEPQLGIADARGAVHADLTLAAQSPAAAADAVADRACRVSDIDGGVRVRDPDGHYLTFTEP